MKDLLVFLSDQHGAKYTGFDGNGEIKTPCLDAIAAEGTAFCNAFTSCPLCVPARSSMLTGLLPSRTGILDNKGCIPEDTPTFLHALAGAGYETVLCGRMHFMGQDQKHGFQRRIFPDITVDYWGRSREYGIWKGTLGEKGCLRLAGKGVSPVTTYDEEVVNASLAYLAEPHDKPICLVVGTYAPHFPYVGPENWYDYYMKNLEEVHYTDTANPALQHKIQHVDASHLRAVRSSYYAMVSQLDAQIGRVHEAFNSYLERWGHKGVFTYLSDHGDHLGEHGLFGKRAFYDGAVRIPFVMCGNGIEKQSVFQPVSIMDLGPTLIGLAGVRPLPLCDGISLSSVLSGAPAEEGRIVKSEVLDEVDGKNCFGQMWASKDAKWVFYHNHGAFMTRYRTDRAENDEKRINDDNLPSFSRYTDAECEIIEKRADLFDSYHEIMKDWGKGLDEEIDVDRWEFPQAILSCMPRS